MADKKELSPNLSAGGSSVLMAGGEEFSLMSCTAKSMGFSLQPCTQAKSMCLSLEATEEACFGDQSAPKRKKAPAADLDGCAPKRREEEVSKEDGDDSDYEEHNAKIRARYAANIQKMFDSNPGVVWVDFPDCCVRPPGVEFPKPLPRRPDGQIDTAKEEEELSGAVVTPPVSA